MANEAEIIASNILSSAIEYKRLYDQTKNNEYKVKEQRLRRIAENVKLLLSSTSTSSVNSFNGRTGAVVLTSADVTTALGYTPPTNLNGLTDVTLSAPANGQVLTYNSTTSQWENQTPAGGGGGGDMLKSTYDVDNSGIVDKAEALTTLGRNSTGATLYEGTIVRIEGSTGNRPNFVKAQANNDANSAQTFGVVMADIANNSDGYVLVQGTLHDLDTRTGAGGATYPFTDVTLADGDLLYLHPTIAGYVTNIKPLAPQHLVYVGVVTRTSPTNGTIVYRIQNGYELYELHDVAPTPYINNGVLYRDTATNLWKSATIATILGGTPLLTIPTLAQVTTAGNTTTNAITVGGLTSNASSIIIGAAAGTLGSRVLTIQGSLPEIFFKDTFGTGTGFSLSKYGSLFYFVNTTSAGAYTNYAGVINPLAASWSFGHGGNPTATVHVKGADVLSSTKALLVQNSSPTDLLTIWNDGAVGINTSTNAGYKLDVNGTARTSQQHTFSQGTYLDALSTNYFHVVDTGAGTYGGLSLKNSINNYNGIIYTGRSGANNAIVFQHTTYSGTPTSDGSQVFTQTYTTFGRFNNGAYGHTLYIHQRSGGVATYPLVISNGINTTNSGVGVLMQTADSTGSVSVNHASIVSWKQNLTTPYVTSDMRFSTISDGANTLSEKMRISSAGNVLVGTTTDGNAKFVVAGSITAASAIARGVYFNNTLVAAANNDVLVGLDINPTFTNGAFTGVTNIDLRTKGTGFVIGSGVGYGAQWGYSNDGIVQVKTNGTSTEMWFRPNNSPASFNSAYWGKIVQANYSLGIYSGPYQSLILATGNAPANGATITFTGAIGVGVDALTIVGPSNYGRIALVTAGSSPITLNGGNILIGTTTDAGYKLDVNGTARVGNDFTIDNNRYLKAYRWTNAATSLPLQLESNSTYNVTGINFISFNNNLLNNTKSLFTFGLVSPITTQSSGSVDVANVINIVPEINFAFGTHTVRGIYYNPTLTSLTGTTHRAIETTSGDVIFNGGNVGVGTTTPTDKFHIVDNTNGNKFGRISAGGTDASAAWVAQNDQVDNVVYRVFGSAVTGTQMGISLARSASLMANLGGSGKFLVGTYSSTDFVMGTGNQERMRLVDTTGNFLIGTTADNGNKLQVSGSIDSTGYSINNIAGYTGLLMIPGNPPGMQNVDIQGGIIVNIF